MAQYYPPEIGAPQVRLRAIVEQFRSLGAEVEVVTAMPNYPTGRIFDRYRGKFRVTEEIDGVTVRRVWIHAAQGAGLARLFGFLSFTALAPFGLLGVQRPDVVIANSTPLTASPPAALAAKRWGVPSVLFISDLWPESLFELGAVNNPQARKLLYRFERWAYESFDLLGPATEGIRAELTGPKGVDPAKVRLMPNGVDTQVFDPQRSPRPLPGVTDRFEHVFLFPGTIGVFNGLDVVLDAMVELTTRRDDIGFLFLGSGSDRRRLEQRVKDEAIGNIVFHDHIEVDELACVLQSVTGGVVSLVDLPITRGARPAKTFPILASAKPVVFVGDSEGGQMVKASGGGFLVDFEDHVGLADAMERLADNPELAQSMGVAGRAYVEQELSWEHIAAEWFEALTELVATS